MTLIDVIEFSPETAGFKEARLVFQTNAQENDTMTLAGSGTTDPFLFQRISLSTDSIDLGIVLPDSIREGDVMLYNNNSSSISLPFLISLFEGEGPIKATRLFVNIFL